MFNILVSYGIFTIGMLRSEVIKNGLFLASSTIFDETKGIPYSTPAPEIFFYNDVTVDSCLELKKNIHTQGVISRNIQKELGFEYPLPIKLHIQSPGGVLASALNVCDYIESFDVPVHTYVEGSVASAASLISVCGDMRFMSRRSVMLIHQPSIFLGSTKQNDIEDESHNLSMLYESMLDIYTSRSKLERNDIAIMIQNEKYLDAKECLKYGFIDKII